MKKITLTISLEDAMILRDALIDASVNLRTNHNGVIISEEKFLALDISDRKRQRYLTMRDYANTLREFCQ